MDPNNELALPTQIILSCNQRSLGSYLLDWRPQPGACIDVAGKTYTVLERRHRYQYRAGRYHLSQVTLLVQTTAHLAERSLWKEHWIIGDVRCRYNARSPVLRCAVNPEGPCADCRSFEALADPAQSLGEDSKQ
jgi:hypothetical protein